MMCARCEELEEEVAYLRSELRLSGSEAEIDRLRDFLGPTGSRGLVVGFVMALHRANGRTLAPWTLLDAMPSPTGNQDRTQELVKSVACFARKALGRDAIETVWGRGYRLSPAAMVRITNALARPERAAA